MLKLLIAIILVLIVVNMCRYNNFTNYSYTCSKLSSVIASDSSKIVLCTFYSQNHVEHCHEFLTQAEKQYNLMKYTEEDISEFYSRPDVYKIVHHEEDGTLGFGYGYYVFKPYVILDAMKQHADGKIIVWSDCNMNKYPGYKNVFSEHHQVNIHKAVDYQDNVKRHV